MTTNLALVITTDSEVWDVTKTLLAGEGYTVEQCGVPTRLLEALGNSAPALILLDAQVGAGDALTLCRAIRCQPGCEFIPLLLVAEKLDAKKAYEFDVTAVFEPPIDPDTLRQHVRSLGDTGKTLSGIRALQTPEADALRAMPDAFFIANKNGLLRHYLGGASGDGLLRPAELEGKFLDDVWPKPVAREALQHIRRVLRTREGHCFEFALEDAAGSARYEMRLLVQGRDRVLLVVRGKAAGEASNPTQTHTDTLTGLPSHALFLQHIANVLNEARLRERTIAALCIDIDRFGRINETLGRAVGDKVLQSAAQRIQSCLRDSDMLGKCGDDSNGCLARSGGDEFVLLLADVRSRNDVAAVADRIRKAFAEPVTVLDNTISIVPSIGIALFPMDGDDAEALLKCARTALAEAKVLSQSKHEFFSNTMQFRALRRLDVHDELRWAIEKGQLELRYLPQFDLAGGNATGVEALLRWIHPLRGSVPLGEVIPLAEATGLIVEIGDWVVRTACEEARGWSGRAAQLSMSVNLSQQEFARDDLVETVAKALQTSRLQADRLALEITETTLLRDRQTELKLRRLHELGVGIVIDDFGQGHSSLAHLARLPVEGIKIDREFVHGSSTDSTKRALCAAVIAMCKELGIRVVAEGVETDVALAFLREKGCDAVQGFYFSEPLPSAELEEFLAQNGEEADASRPLKIAVPS